MSTTTDNAAEIDIGPALVYGWTFSMDFNSNTDNTDAIAQLSKAGVGTQSNDDARIMDTFAMSGNFVTSGLANNGLHASYNPVKPILVDEDEKLHLNVLITGVVTVTAYCTIFYEPVNV